MLLPNKPCSKIDPAALAPIVGCCVSLLLVHLVYVHILPTSTAQSAPELKIKKSIQENLLALAQ